MTFYTQLVIEVNSLLHFFVEQINFVSPRDIILNSNTRITKIETLCAGLYIGWGGALSVNAPTPTYRNARFDLYTASLHAPAYYRHRSDHTLWYSTGVDLHLVL